MGEKEGRSQGIQLKGAEADTKPVCGKQAVAENAEISGASVSTFTFTSSRCKVRTA